MATVTTISSTKIFKDLDLNFSIHPIRKDVNVFKNEYAIINAVKNLILTNHYERPFRPQLGSNLRRLLFENVDGLLAAQIEREIEETINNFEPRVSIIDVRVDDYSDANEVYITLEFKIVNTERPLTLDLALERTR
jgi:phage baseplate assembly protein W